MNSRTLTGIKRGAVLFLLALIAACGGGGGGGGPSSTGTTVPPTGTLSGAVIDGYITGATVCLDLNSNGICDPGEPTTTTGANGSYSFNYLLSVNLSNLNVIAFIPAGATDSDNPGTPVATAYQLIAQASQPLVVTPLTTLVSQYVSANPGVSATTAATQVVTTLGLPSGTNLFQDYVANSNTALHNVAQVVNTVIQNADLGTTPTLANLNTAIAVAATYTSVATTTTGNISTLLSSATAAAVSASGTLITNVPTPTYTNDNLTAFSLLNAIRQKAGAGLLVQSVSLDTAAANHTGFLVNNNLVSNATYLNSTVSVSGVGILGGHYENPTLAGYTGTTPQIRATTAGFALGTTGSVSELLSFGSATGTVCTSSLEDSVYHLVQLLSPFLDIGISLNVGNGSGAVCDMELGIPGSESGQLPPAGNWVSYPANAQSGVPPTFFNQSESPVPAPDLASAGHPIVVSLYNKTNTTLTAAQVVLHTFTLASGTTSIATRVLAQSGVTTTGTTLTVDPNISGPGILVLLPTSPLSANTTYTVTFSATANGTAVNKIWSFTTGSAN